MFLSSNTSLFNFNWHIKLLIVFTFLAIIGFTPWEDMLSIQIRNNVLSWFASPSIGLIGVIGLSLTLIIRIRNRGVRFSFMLITLLSFIAVVSGLLLMLSLVLPSFAWEDRVVYSNNNDYIVVQDQKTFVTSNLTYPRIIHTSSPYAIIRPVKEQHYLKAGEDHFFGDKINYEGKVWIKESIK